MKLLEEIRVVSHFELWLGKNLLSYDTKVKTTKEKMEKLDFIKVETGFHQS
jgi:hypothetical protein